jgi:hypothetical protein
MSTRTEFDIEVTLAAMSAGSVNHVARREAAGMHHNSPGVQYNSPSVGASSRHVIGAATGTPVGRRRCAERRAFDEFAAAVSRTDMSLGSICHELVELTSGTTNSFHNRSEVVGPWGDLVAGRSTQLLGAGMDCEAGQHA